MLKIIPVLLTVLLMLGDASMGRAESDGERQRAFVRALELFDAAKSPEDYRLAANQLESLLVNGYRNGAVFYNLGNAYYRAGEYGRAILNYRKALSYRPRDPYLKANLQQAIASAPGRMKEPSSAWWSPVFFWSQWMAYRTRVGMVAIGFCLSAFLVALAYGLRSTLVRNVALSLLGLSLLLAIEVGANYRSALMIDHAVITGETIARKGTGTSYEPAFDQPLKDGAEFRVLEQTADWTFGHFEGIGDGWVRNEFVAR